jgi:hypothetical protein
MIFADSVRTLQACRSIEENYYMALADLGTETLTPIASLSMACIKPIFDCGCANRKRWPRLSNVACVSHYPHEQDQRRCNPGGIKCL